MSATLLGFVSLAVLVGSFGLWFRRIQRVQIPEDRRPWVATWLAAAALGIYALSQGPGWIGAIPAGVGAIGGIFVSVLVYISPQRVADDAIRVGERLRDFTALDENGNEFAIASTAGTPVLLKFFRGHW